MTPIAMLFFFIIPIVGGVWGTIVNRRWIILIIYSTAVISTIVVFYFYAGNEMVVDFALPMIEFLVFGLFVDVFLFQINAAKRLYGKVFWSLIAALILSLIVATPFRSVINIMYLVNDAVIFVIPFSVFLIIVSYAGSGITNILRRISPNIFEIFVFPPKS